MFTLDVILATTLPVEAIARGTLAAKFNVDVGILLHTNVLLNHL